MKLAKKALVVVMALALIGCMSVMAFAAGSVTLTKVDEKNVAITAVGAIGMKSFDFIITADDGIVLKNVKASSDANDCTAADNAFTTEKNMAEGKYSGYFKYQLWTKDQFAAAADDLGEELSDSFDPNNFDMGTIVYDASAAKGPAYIYVKGSIAVDGGADINVDLKVLVVEGEVVTEAPTTAAPVTAAPVTEAPVTEAPVTEAPVTDAPVTDAPATDAPATDAPATEAPATEAPATEAPTKAAPVDTGDVPTGDNMALAAAAAVVVLAGAAFVITKKRK